MRHIAVIGTGYVGLVTGACFAQLGNIVVCLDVEPSRIESLQRGTVPFFEPGLQELVLRNLHSGRLSFTSGAAEGLRGSEIVFIAVGTPMGSDGHADLAQVRSAAMDIALHLDREKIVVNKSTVPVETGDLVSALIREHKRVDHRVMVVSNPEFLREGSAIADFMRPDRIVIGAGDSEAVESMKELYAPLEAPVIVTDIRTAEMIKYTANAFLATKISFTNEIANICEQVGADVKDVVLGVGADKRIGSAFMNAGLGFGGSCFPKDLVALSRIAEAVGVDPQILSATISVNQRQIERCIEAVRTMAGTLRGTQIGLLGLAFKPDTDDIRDSQAIALAQGLIAAGAIVTAHDPVANGNTRAQHGEIMKYVDSPYETANDADLLIVATDWSEYKQIDLIILKKLMRHARLFDARNIYDPAKIIEAGFIYRGVGRRVSALPAQPLADEVPEKRT
jgi:UDPglucose 6-dehydrogenase